MLKYKYSNYNLEIKGHALFAQYGNDIVCSAVSTAIIVSVNLITKLDLIDKIEYILDEGYFKIKILDHKNDILIKILDNLVYTLKNIEQQYPKYIKEDK